MNDKTRSVNLMEQLKAKKGAEGSDKPQEAGVTEGGVEYPKDQLPENVQARTAETEVVANPKLSPKSGQVLFEPAEESMPITTALPDGREITLPYIAKNQDEVDWLRAFATHHEGWISEVEGK